MVRTLITILLVFFGFMAPTWLFLVTLFISTLAVYNFWEVILVTIIVNSLYVYQGEFFSAQYILWGIAAYLCGMFVYRMTRLRDTQK